MLTLAALLLLLSRAGCCDLLCVHLIRLLSRLLCIHLLRLTALLRWSILSLLRNLAWLSRA